jgi:hypothetical protein
MYWTYTSPTISGHHIEVWTFVGFWFRELLLVAFVAFGAVVLAGFWLWEVCQKVFRR